VKNEGLALAQKATTEEEYLTPRDRFLMKSAWNDAIEIGQALNLVTEARYRFNAVLGDIASAVIYIEGLPEKQQSDRLASHLRAWETDQTWESTVVEAAYEYERAFRQYSPLFEGISPGSTHPDNIKIASKMAGEFAAGLHALFPELGSTKSSDGGQKLREVVAALGTTNVREAIRSLQSNPIKIGRPLDPMTELARELVRKYQAVYGINAWAKIGARIKRDLHTISALSEAEQALYATLNDKQSRALRRYLKELFD
jgi:hypothetical protein